MKRELARISYGHILHCEWGVFCCQLLPFLTALTSLILLLLTLALSKVHIKVSVSSPCIVVSSCCHSSGWLLSKQPHFVIQSLNLITIPCLTAASKDQALSLSASFSLYTLNSCLAWWYQTSARLAISLLHVCKWCYKKTKQVFRTLFSIFLGDNAGTQLKPEGYNCKRQWERWIVQIQRQVGLQRTLTRLMCFLAFS